MVLCNSPDYQTCFESVGLSVQEKVQYKFLRAAIASILDFQLELSLLILIYKSPQYFQ